MLIRSPRHSADDLRVWAERERADATYARLHSFDARQEKALATAARFALAGPCYASVSWGKDSMVIAHLAVRLRKRLGVVCPIVWVRVEPIKNPDCETTRDAFFRCFDHPYHEVEVWCSRDDEGWHATGTLERGFAEACRVAGAERSLRGIRADEAGYRKALMERSGACSKHACRPIGWWSGQDVFAYLYRHDLPMHPAYAMSMGGMLDRDRIRVSSIGGRRGTGQGRAEWERRYYERELREILGSLPMVGVL